MRQRWSLASSSTTRRSRITCRFPSFLPRLARELVQLNVLAPVAPDSRGSPWHGRAGGKALVINVASLLAFSVDRGRRRTSHGERCTRRASRSWSPSRRPLPASCETAACGCRLSVPGSSAPEFHSRQGLDMSTVPRMEPTVAVVQASLLDLERGEVVVSIPGAERRVCPSGGHGRPGRAAEHAREKSSYRTRYADAGR